MQPPINSLRFLRWFCREDCIEEIEGNLVELFEKRYLREPRHARWSFTWQVIRHLRPDFVKSSIGSRSYQLLMLAGILS